MRDPCFIFFLGKPSSVGKGTELTRFASLPGVDKSTGPSAGFASQLADRKSGSLANGTFRLVTSS